MHGALGFSYGFTSKAGGIQNFPEGVPTRKSEGRQSIIGPKFAENCMKMEKIGRGRPKCYYVDPPP